MQNRVRWVVKPRKCNSNSTSGSARIWTAWEESCPAATQDWEPLVQTAEGALPFFHFFHFPPHLLRSIRCRERMMIYSKLLHGRIVVQGCRRSTTCWQQKWSDISGFEHFWRCPTTPFNCLPRMLVTWRLGAHRNGASIRQGLSSPKKQLLHRGLGKRYEGQGLETLNTFKKIPWYWALLEQTPTDTQFFNDLATYWGRSTELEHRWMWKGVSAPSQNKKLITSHRPVGRSCRRPWPSKPLRLRFFGFLWAKPLSAKHCQIGPQAVHELRSLLRDMQLKFDTQLRRDIWHKYQCYIWTHLIYLFHFHTTFVTCPASVSRVRWGWTWRLMRAKLWDDRMIGAGWIFVILQIASSHQVPSLQVPSDALQGQ